MLRHAVLAAALLVGPTGCPAKSTCPGATTTGAGAGAGADATVTDVMRAVEQWRQASEDRSIDALFPLYDHGDSITLVTQGVPLVGWDAVSADLSARLARAKQIHYRLTDVTVTPIGTGAVATGALAREISDGVTSVADNGTVTLAFGKDAEGKWVIVAEHFSFRR